MGISHQIQFVCLQSHKYQAITLRTNTSGLLSIPTTSHHLLPAARSLNSNETVPVTRMEDQRPRSSRKNPSRETSPAGPTSRRSKGRFAVDDGGDLMECSGKFCQSCTAGMIADCVALCCCPCAVLHCFVLAFVKAPWMAGRRCLGLGKKKRKRKTKRIEDDVVLERNHREVNTSSGWIEESILEMVSGEMAIETEKVWKEMYEIGHFGFFRRNSN